MSQQQSAQHSHPCHGLWMTRDGYIRHELLPDGRYEEARGEDERANQGRYVVHRDHIEYFDESGFTARGILRDGVLYHAGMVLLYRAESQQAVCLCSP